MKNYRSLLVIGGFIILLCLFYKEPNMDCSQQMGTSWKGYKPQTTKEVEIQNQINSGFRSYNSGYINKSSNGYETIEIIRENKVGPKTYYDIKHKIQSKPEIDLTDPYIQDRIEDELDLPR